MEGTQVEGVRPAHQLQVELLQTAPQLGDVAGNLRRIDGLVADSAADLCVAPELGLHGYFIQELDTVEALPRDDPRLSSLGRHGPAVVTGFVESWRHHHYNSAAIVDTGSVSVQRKLFLPNYLAWEERKHFRPGERLHLLQARGVSAAVLVCNDLWHPVLPWLAAHAGAEVLFVIANSVESRSTVSVQESWMLLLKHAAVTLQCYVVFVNRVGTEAGQRFWGGSCVIGLDGETLVELSAQEESGTAVLDLQRLRAVRRRWPVLNESRLEFVGREALRLAQTEHL
jgi:predicted amidohydrolase